MSDRVVTGTEDAGNRGYIAFLLFLAAATFFLTLHLLTQSGAPIPVFPDWSYAFDNYVDTLNGTSDSTAGDKHPLYVLLGRPLYSLGVSLFDAEASPDGMSRAIVLPSALFGSLTVFVAGLIFLRNLPDRLVAGLFTTLYALSSVHLFVSSFPDTYSLTGFMGALFFLLVLSRDIWASPARLAALNAVAAFAAPQQLFLAIVPAVRAFLDFTAGIVPFGAFMRAGATYTLVLLAVFVVPYFIFLEVAGEGWYFPRAYLGYIGEPENVTRAGNFLTAIEHHLVYSVITPPIHWEILLDGLGATLSAAPASWGAILAVFAVFVIVCLSGLVRTDAQARPFIVPILAYAAFYTFFFVFFIAEEPYLASNGLLLPWLLILQSGFGGLRAAAWRLILAVTVLAVAVNAVSLFDYLRAVQLAGV